MPVWVKMIWTAFVVITVAMAIYIFVWLGALAGGCGNDMLATIPSPSGGRKLVIFQRACGATTGFSTQASLLPALTDCEAAAMFSLRTPITARLRAALGEGLN
jgi:hypothetical protein